MPDHLRKAMTVSRRGFLHVAAGAAGSSVLPHGVRAQAYPTRPVRIIVGFPAGGTTDMAARVISQWLSERLGPQFIFEDRTGPATKLSNQAVGPSASR